MKNLVGKILENRYRIQEVIGVGGMSVVYKAVDLSDNKIVAVKVLKQEFFEDEQFRLRFINESKAIAMLSHKNIVKIYDVGLNDDLYFIVMEYIDGITLKQYIEQQGRLSWREAVYFVSQVLEALRHAHQKGIVHRDIKPQNIMLLSSGAICVTDFGIARIATNNTHTMADKAIGSVHYISPEQVSGGKTDFRSDLYSVGVILYEMVTGKVPFDAENPVSVALMQLQSTPKRPSELVPDIPDGLEDIILKAMAKNPDLRYQSASEMLADIDEFKHNPSARFEYKYFSDENPTKYMDAIKTERCAAEPKKQKKYAGVITGILAAVVLVGLLIFGAVSLFGGGEDAPAAPVVEEEVVVENLVGQKLDRTLEERYPDIKIVEERREPSDKFEEGYIISQSPEDGIRIKKGSEVKVVVSSGKGKISIPDVSGEDYNKAKSELEGMGLTVKRTESYHDTVGEGKVISSNPKEGTEVEANSVVTLRVSLGPENTKIKVPGVVGESESAAQKKLSDAGLVVTIKTVDSDQPEGTVVAQSIDKDTEVEKNTSIEISVSNGSKITYEKEQSFILPTDKESFVVTVKLDGVKVYEEIHTAEDKLLKLTLKGRGSQIVELYIDGVLKESGYINFNE